MGLFKGAWYKKIFASIILLFLLICIYVLCVDNDFLGLFGRSPGTKDIKNPITSEASEIYSADSILIGRFYNENRSPVTFEQISPILIQTLIDTEDVRFYQHKGIDIKGLFSAIKDMAQGKARGASTITQQLAKNLFRVRTQYSTGRLGKIKFLKMPIMKTKEWIVATKLEQNFTKEEILTMYLNTVDFGSNTFGIKTASRFYFNTTPDKLNYQQAATLVGLLKATSTYNPRINPKNSLKRRNIVLDNLYDNKHLVVNNSPATQQQLDSIQQLPIILSPRTKESSYDGPARYFRAALTEHIEELCEGGYIQGELDESNLDLYADGLKIYTTIDLRMQKYAEEALRKKMSELQVRFDNHWGKTNPWQDDQRQEIPNFLEDLAKKTSYYKALKERFNDNQDSINFYLNLPRTIKVFTYDGEKEMQLSTIDSIRHMVRFMHSGFIAIEPQTGYIKAWMGNITFNRWKFDKLKSLTNPAPTFNTSVNAKASIKGLRHSHTFFYSNI